MFHTSAFFASIGAVTNSDVPALADAGIIPITNNHFIPPQDMWCVAAYASAVTMTRSRLNSGHIRQVSPLYISPFGTNLLPGDDVNLMDLRTNPFKVYGMEELANEVSESAVGPNNYYSVIWLSPTRVLDPAPPGDIFKLRITSTTAAVASAWTSIAVTFETGLPAGKWAIVGCSHQSTTGIAFRLTCDNQYLRPGGLSRASLGFRHHYMQYNGGLGKWGEFSTFSPPRFEVLCNAADAAHEIILEVIRLA